MSDIVGRLRRFGGDRPFANGIERAAFEAANLIEQLERENAELREALEPFATAGRIIDGPFGPALFAEDDMAFQSGCAWSENGERRTITWGDFRRARRLAEQEGTE